MKYYGIKIKIRKEDFMYKAHERKTWFLSKIPIKNNRWADEYHYTFSKHFSVGLSESNAIPEGKKCELHEIVTIDMIKREDIRILQKGLSVLLRKYRSAMVLGAPTDSVEEVLRKISKMDSSLSVHYEGIDCGFFDFSGLPFQNRVKVFGVRIRNINTSYLGIEFSILLSDSEKEQLNRLIHSEYSHIRGYLHAGLVEKRPRGSKRYYGWIQYDQTALKADRIFEKLSCFLWDFYNELNPLFPFLLHNSGIMPPRIEVYATDIDYRDGYESFWKGLGVISLYGQFMNENHKIFFYNELSARYKEESISSRVVYIFREDGSTGFEAIRTTDEDYYKIRDYGIAVLKLMLLQIMHEEAGRIIVRNKHKLDKIRLEKNKLRQLLKLRYHFEYELDPFRRLVKDCPWDGSEQILSDFFSENDKIIKELSNHPKIVTWKNFYDGIVEQIDGINGDICLLKKEFDQKQEILQRLFDYRNTKRTWRLGIATIFVASMTLYFTIWPEHGRFIFEKIMRWIRHIL